MSNININAFLLQLSAHDNLILSQPVCTPLPLRYSNLCNVKVFQTYVHEPFLELKVGKRFCTIHHRSTRLPVTEASALTAANLGSDPDLWCFAVCLYPLCLSPLSCLSPDCQIKATENVFQEQPQIQPITKRFGRICDGVFSLETLEVFKYQQSWHYPLIAYSAFNSVKCNMHLSKKILQTQLCSFRTGWYTTIAWRLKFKQLT